MSGVDLKAYAKALKVPLFQGNTVQPLIGGEETFRAMREAIEETASSGSASFVYLLGWHLEVDTPMAGIRGPKTLGDILAAADHASVQIRVNLWNNPLTPNHSAIEYINGLKNGIAVGDSSAPSEPLPGASHHQKVLVVRGARGLVAFCGGLDISKDRLQPVFRPRGSPMFDVHCEIRGPAANALLATFVDRWRQNLAAARAETGKEKLRGVPVAATMDGNAATPARGGLLTGIATTMNRLVSRYTPDFGPTEDTFCAESRSVAIAVAGAIAAAKRFIYIEDQYLTSLRIAGLLNQKLKDLQYVAILVTHHDISDEPGVAAARAKFVETALRGLASENQQKLRLFYRIYDAEHPNQFRYIHSKLWIIDDVIAIIGSANATERSWWLDSEASAVVIDDPSDLKESFARRVRTQVWSQHLGVKPTDIWCADTIEVVKKWWDQPMRAGNLVRSYAADAKAGGGAIARALDPLGEFRPCA